MEQFDGSTRKPVRAIFEPPFKREHQLSNQLDYLSHANGPVPLPSQPWLPMSSGKRLIEFLRDDICPTKLNRLAPHLWLCSMPSHTNVPAFHNHAIHGRSILPTEDPALHLVWLTGRIFIKPLPLYLLSHAFWMEYLYKVQAPEKVVIAQAALGLLRSYHHSIRHENDLRIAQQSHLNLLPHDITWKQWCDFSANFDAIDDNQVAPRYHYGKLQLSRLHWLVRVYLREMSYYYLDGGYGDSFARYYGPLLFVFGVLSVLLSAMQVGMAAEQIQSRGWSSFWSACRWFSVISLCGLAVLSLFLLIAFVIKSLDEMIWAVRAQYRARRKPVDLEN